MSYRWWATSFSSRSASFCLISATEFKRDIYVILLAKINEMFFFKEFPKVEEESHYWKIVIKFLSRAYLFNRKLTLARYENISDW